jgi:SAM-dependent methyltransferase
MAKMKLFRDRYLGEPTSPPLRVLDIGSQDINGSYRELFEGSRWHYVGADSAPGKNVDIVLTSPYRWNEFADSEFDVVICGQAFEHIEFFWITMLEIGRVLKPGGLCCIIAPGSGFEHRRPVDCWRFYSDGMQALARWARLDVLQATTQWESEHHPDGSDIWKDSVLIASKPRYSRIGALKQRLKYRLVCEVLGRVVQFSHS